MNAPLILNLLSANLYLKNVFAFAGLIFFVSTVSFSQTTLPVDDSTRKITFEEIVKPDSVSLMVLQKNAEKWMDKNFKSPNAITQVDPMEAFNESEGRFLVYTKGGISKEIHGAIRFKVRIYIKPGKYRYVFTDFVFEYYKQDRQYKYVPTGKEKPLEDPKFPGWEKPWRRYKLETYQKITSYIEGLKNAIVYQDKPMEKKPVVKKEQW